MFECKARITCHRASAALLPACEILSKKDQFIENCWYLNDIAVEILKKKNTR